MSLSTKLSLDLLPHTHLAYEHSLTKYKLPNKCQLASAAVFQEEVQVIPSVWVQLKYPARAPAFKELAGPAGDARGCGY